MKTIRFADLTNTCKDFVADVVADAALYKVSVDELADRYEVFLHDAQLNKCDVIEASTVQGLINVLNECPRAMRVQFFTKASTWYEDSITHSSTP